MMQKSLVQSSTVFGQADDQNTGQLMSLGSFVFELSTLSYSQLQRNNSWRNVATDTVGADPAYQHLGAGPETFNMSGVVYQELGNRKHLDTLREMADAGEAYALVDAAGHVYGLYLVNDMSETGTYFNKDGTPKKSEFTISLTRAKRAQKQHTATPAGALSVNKLRG